MKRIPAIGLALCALCASVANAAAPIDSAQAVRAIVGEAADQGERGMLAVAGAIRNRGTLRGVYGLRNPAVALASAETFSRAQRAWAMSATNDMTGGATHWENVKAFGTPKWAKEMIITARIGDHTFYRSAVRKT